MSAGSGWKLTFTLQPIDAARTVNIPAELHRSRWIGTNHAEGLVPIFDARHSRLTSRLPASHEAAQPYMRETYGGLSVLEDFEAVDASVPVSSDYDQVGVKEANSS